jgi:hypothetical protein
MSDDGEVVAFIGGDLAVGGFDGAGSGFGLSSCASCGRIIDRTCSVCSPPAPSPMSSDEVLRGQQELREQGDRERRWFKKGER